MGLAMDELLLGIESSCDETACAVVRPDGYALSNEIASQAEMHSPYGGVVPELASRAHIRNMLPIYRAALDRAGVSIGDISAIAVTQGPGLVGSLLAGFETAKALGFAHGIPVRAIHHVAAHAYSPFVSGPAAGGEGFLPEGFDFPYLALVVSGGHTSLIRADAPDQLKTLAQTVDDAAGEAYDKVARLLGLGYPGGPVIDRLAAKGDPKAFAFKRPRLKSGKLGFSFSGLKTAVSREVQRAGKERFGPEEQMTADLAASFQACVIDSLLGQAKRVLEAEGLDRLAVTGGVACNRGLRAAAAERLGGIALVFPPPLLCTDNAAMIGALGGALGDRAPKVALSRLLIVTLGSPLGLLSRMFPDHVSSPEELAVELPAYLNGLGEVVGELRRHLLDALRGGDVDHCERTLAAMDDIYSVLVTIDYPDAMTAGLRRTTDAVRGILERTRGDLTVAVRQRELEQRLADFQERLS